MFTGIMLKKAQHVSFVVFVNDNLSSISLELGMIFIYSFLEIIAALIQPVTNTKNIALYVIVYLLLNQCIY